MKNKIISLGILIILLFTFVPRSVLAEDDITTNFFGESSSQKLPDTCKAGFTGYELCMDSLLDFKITFVDNKGEQSGKSVYYYRNAEIPDGEDLIHETPGKAWDSGIGKYTYHASKTNKVDIVSKGAEQRNSHPFGYLEYTDDLSEIISNYITEPTIVCRLMLDAGVITKQSDCISSLKNKHYYAKIEPVYTFYYNKEHIKIDENGSTFSWVKVRGTAKDIAAYFRKLYDEKDEKECEHTDTCAFYSGYNVFGSMFMKNIGTNMHVSASDLENSGYSKNAITTTNVKKSDFDFPNVNKYSWISLNYNPNNPYDPDKKIQDPTNLFSRYIPGKGSYDKDEDKNHYYRLGNFQNYTCYSYCDDSKNYRNDVIKYHQDSFEKIMDSKSGYGINIFDISGTVNTTGDDPKVYNYNCAPSVNMCINDGVNTKISELFVASNIDTNSNNKIAECVLFNERYKEDKGLYCTESYNITFSNFENGISFDAKPGTFIGIGSDNLPSIKLLKKCYSTGTIDKAKFRSTIKDELNINENLEISYLGKLYNLNENHVVNGSVLLHSEDTGLPTEYGLNYNSISAIAIYKFGVTQDKLINKYVNIKTGIGIIGKPLDNEKYYSNTEDINLLVPTNTSPGTHSDNSIRLNAKGIATAVTYDNDKQCLLEKSNSKEWECSNEKLGICKTIIKYDKKISYEIKNDDSLEKMPDNFVSEIIDVLSNIPKNLSEDGFTIEKNAITFKDDKCFAEYATCKENKNNDLLCIWQTYKKNSKCSTITLSYKTEKENMTKDSCTELSNNYSSVYKTNYKLESDFSSDAIVLNFKNEGIESNIDLENITCNFSVGVKERSVLEKIVYRPIDLSNPFPGKSGNGRALTDNSNWSVSSVYKYITNRQDVYSKKPLYSFTLTPSKIKEIQKYNSTHTYDDFTLNCDKTKDGETNCISTFFRGNKSTIQMNDNSNCKDRKVKNFDTCVDYNKR